MPTLHATPQPPALRHRRRMGVAVAVCAAVLLAGCGGTTTARTPHASGPRDAETGLPWVEVASLPSQARDTLRLIDAGGPYPYPGKDGRVFRNAEGLLPREPRGWYHEYTVVTPGASNRSTRRIITGDGTRLFFYTADHYRSFARIRR
ncbi:MAG: ribonuclease domain-containing protein [Thermoleophilia bacterium]